MKNEIDTLLQKEMDRKSFLKHVAIAFVALTGVGVLLKTLNGFNGSAPFGSAPQTNGNGYGTSPYGGSSVAVNDRY